MLSALPAIAYTPTTAWMFGVAPGVSWFMGDPSTTNISSGLGSVIYTTKKQWIITAKTNMFLEGDSWNLLGDWRYFITSQPTYGLGIGYHLDIHSKFNDNMLNLDTVPPVITSHYGYQTLAGISTESCTLSGISLNALLDIRMVCHLG